MTNKLTISPYNLDTVIHSGIVAAYRSVAIKLWYLCRGMDVKGDGKVKLHVDLISEVLNMSLRQVARNIEKLKQDGLIRSFRKVDGFYVIYYSGVLQVAKSLGCNLGTCFWLNLVELKNLKKNLIQANFDCLQRQADYKVRKDFEAKEIEAFLSHEYIKDAYPLVDNNKDLKKFGVQVSSDFLPTRPINHGNAVIGFVEEKSTLLISEWVRIGFASYEAVAKVLGISVKSIYLHLKDVPKIRIGYWRKNNAELRDSLRLANDGYYKRFISFKRKTKGDSVIEMSGIVIVDDPYVLASKKFQKNFIGDWS